MAGIDFLGYALGSFVWLIIGIVLFALLIIAIVTVGMIVVGTIEWFNNMKREKEMNKYYDSRLKSIKDLYEELSKVKE
jgi:hypothetical protein